MRPNLTETPRTGPRGMPPALAVPLRLVILDTCELVAAGLGAMLADYRDRIHVVQVTTEPSDIGVADVVLADLFDPARDGVGELRDLTGVVTAPVVAFSWGLPPHRIAQVLAAGAAGYLSKSLKAKEIVDALEAVRAGETVIMTGDLAVADPPAAGVSQPWLVAGLSPREAEVLSLISQGLTNQQIAERAYIGINSVKTYIRTAYRKIGVTNRSLAVRWGVEHGFDTFAPAKPTPERCAQPVDPRCLNDERPCDER